MLHGLPVHADALIPDAYLDMIPPPGGGNMDRPAVMAEFDGISDQIQPHMIQHFLISIVVKCFQADIKRHLFRLPLALQTKNASANLFIQLIYPALSDDLLVFIFGQQEDVGGEVG